MVPTAQSKQYAFLFNTSIPPDSVGILYSLCHVGLSRDSAYTSAKHPGILPTQMASNTNFLAWSF